MVQGRPEFWTSHDFKDPNPRYNRWLSGFEVRDPELSLRGFRGAVSSLPVIGRGIGPCRLVFSLSPFDGLFHVIDAQKRPLPITRRGACEVIGISGKHGSSVVAITASWLF